MKLDVNQLRYLQGDEFRVLQAVELGQRNVSIQDPMRFLSALTPNLRGLGDSRIDGRLNEAQMFQIAELVCPAA